MENLRAKINLITKNVIFQICLLVLLSFGLTIVSLYYSVGELGREMFFSYFSNGLTIFLNFLPILWLMILVYAITRKTSISFLITCIISYGITLISHFKVTLRNDPLLMEDVTLIKEAIGIQGKYTFNFSKLMIILTIFFVILTVLLYFFVDKNRNKDKSDEQEKRIDKKKILIRVVSSISIFIIGIILLNTVYVNSNIYAKLANEKLINRWSQTHQYISRGTMYSFLYSYTAIRQTVPEGYDKNEAKEALYQYSYSDIPEDKKVNVISIMLEAFNDFSKFDSVEFTTNPYEAFYEIKEQSISSELVTNIFAGGTVDTERKFLTGYTSLPNFRKETNSYVQYFREQGYDTSGSHPSYNWFYNRMNVNRNLGFNRYYFYEDRYVAFSGDVIAGDSVFIPDVLKLYNDRDKSKPYFNFSVTYQNHGPYGTVNYYGREYIKRKEGYTDEGVNILNNYFWGIENTSNELLNMINSLKEDEDPVVVIIFGDHNPWLGDNNSVYEMLGIDLNLDTEEGIYNYYSTPYIIWANDKAKEVLENDFVGEGDRIGPYFLMNEFFELAGYEGNEFMKASNTLKDKITVVNDNFYVVDGKVERELSEEDKNIFNEFDKIQYYWSKNYRSK